jgi:ABC-type transporter Mla MlaB component
MTDALTGRGWSVRADASRTVVALTGDWIAREAAAPEPDAVPRILEGAHGKAIAFDTADLGRWDSALLVFLSALRQEAEKRALPFDGTGLPQSASGLLALIAEPPPETTPAPAMNGSALRDGVNWLGNSAIDVWREGLAVHRADRRHGPEWRPPRCEAGSGCAAAILLTCIYDAGDRGAADRDHRQCSGRRHCRFRRRGAITQDSAPIFSSPPLSASR